MASIGSRACSSRLRAAAMDGIRLCTKGFRKTQTRTKTAAAAIPAILACSPKLHPFVGCALSKMRRTMTKVCALHSIGWPIMALRRGEPPSLGLTMVWCVSQ